ncbi:MAG TPA: hypothetical protein VGE10_08990 [Zeimonas sp.]
MSFAVRIDTAPRALQQRVPPVLAAFAVAASLFALAFAEPSQRGWIALAAIACFGTAFGRHRLRRRGGMVPDPRGRREMGGAGAGLTEGSLRIDEAGGVRWIDAHDPDRCARPVRIERWNVLGPFAWLRLRFEDGAGALDVTFARRRARTGDTGETGEDDWRRLRAWLLWYGRGTAPAGRSAAARARQ